MIYQSNDNRNKKNTTNKLIKKNNHLFLYYLKGAGAVPIAGPSQGPFAYFRFCYLTTLMLTSG